MRPRLIGVKLRQPIVYGYITDDGMLPEVNPRLTPNRKLANWRVN